MAEHWSEKETRWNRIRYGQGKWLSSVSKFQTNEATISIDEIARDWPGWNDEERFDFISAYQRKPSYDDEDIRIIKFLMENAGPLHMSMMAMRLTMLPDKKQVSNYLMRQIIQMKTDDMLLGNFYQAIGAIGEEAAIPLLKERVHEMLNNPELYEKGGSSNELAGLCISAVAALYRLERNEEYKRLLEGFKLHPNELVAQHAAAILDQTIYFMNREYEKSLNSVVLRWN